MAAGSEEDHEMSWGSIRRAPRGGSGIDRGEDVEDTEGEKENDGKESAEDKDERHGIEEWRGEEVANCSMEREEVGWWSSVRELDRASGHVRIQNTINRPLQNPHHPTLRLIELIPRIVSSTALNKYLTNSSSLPMSSSSTISSPNLRASAPA